MFFFNAPQLRRIPLGGAPQIPMCPICLLTPRIGALVLLVCVACGPKNETPRTPRELAARSSDTTVKAQTAALVVPTGDTALKYTYVIRDSAGVFDPGGYNSPVDTLEVSGITLVDIEFVAVWYYYGGQLHYDKPQVLTEPVAMLSYAEVGSDGAREGPVKCAHVVATPDTVSIVCPGSLLGDVLVEGRFVTTDSTLNLKETACENLALIARVVVRREGLVVHDKVHRFTCFSGD